MSGEGFFEDRELPPDGSQTPLTATYIVEYMSNLLSTYQWYAVIIVICVALVWVYYGPEKRKSKPMNLSASDAASVLSRQEAMERARNRMQEEYNVKAEEHAVRQRQKDDLKRKEQVEAFERQQQGLGTKKRSTDSTPSNETAPSTSKPNKSPLRQGFSAMMGGSSTAYRPSRPSGARGG